MYIDAATVSRAPAIFKVIDLSSVAVFGLNKSNSQPIVLQLAQPGIKNLVRG
jgi:hypothetical protein